MAHFSDAGAGAEVLRGTGGKLKLPIAFADRRIGLWQAKVFPFCAVFRQFQKRVFVEHLVHFLAQFQGRQLQKANGLLQLGRERQMLRYPQ